MKALVRGALAWMGYEIRGTRFVPRQLRDHDLLRVLELDDVICRRMVERGPELCFLQVGAYDGVTADPLHGYVARHGWRGLLVEPQAAAAARLRTRYAGNSRVEIVQAAIDRTASRRTLYRVEGEGLPAWAGGLASFDRENLLKHAHALPGLGSHLREEQVDCVPFETILARLGGVPLDLLQLDVEGLDDQLLSIFPFEGHRPAIVHFEIKHLSTSRREACFARLLRFGYRIAPSGHENAMGVLPAGERREAREGG